MAFLGSLRRSLHRITGPCGGGSGYPSPAAATARSLGTARVRLTDFAKPRDTR
jgi:hypothetical protein